MEKTRKVFFFYSLSKLIFLFFFFWIRAPFFYLSLSLLEICINPKYVHAAKLESWRESL